jgi:hypothetical protein
VTEALPKDLAANPRLATWIEVDADGTVGVPDGPGLGTPLNREWIAAHEVDVFVAD